MNRDDDFESLKGAEEPTSGVPTQNHPAGVIGDDLTANYPAADPTPSNAAADEGRSTTPSGTVDNASNAVPQKVGRYTIKKLLGRGGFGEVYLGFDEQLKREVAIKLTFRSKVGPAAITMFLAEAQVLADLDHPNIVPVYDIGTTERGDIFIVSKLIDGMDLANRIEQSRPSRELSLEIIATIAEALHYAHGKGLIHRDVKPANILLDRFDRPYLTDFGIALRETDQARAGEIAGTPSYMSPEQARGEGHLMTPQSDIYSLGVVLYELLSGRRLFRAKSVLELLRMVQSTEIRTPRTFDATIPRELERICLKALERRPSDRFAIAKDFADEVRYVLSNRLELDPTHRATTAPLDAHPPAFSFERARSSDGPDPKRTPSELPFANQLDSDLRSGSVRVIPKGLRSFDEKDSDFFLELLPGPFDRTGLPEGLRFWKNRIESSQVEESFRVGLVYGPSGCGKSSLIKAGLLPRLSPKVESIYIDATPADTTGKLLREIHKRIPEVAGTHLADTLGIIRRRKLVPSGGKLLLVIDQFEQWLYANKNYADAELTNALRQCDGITVQAIVMVRDDFWLSVSRFLRELDIPILERENSALVDLFDIDHAKKVLALFGRAYDKLSEDRSEWTEDQRQFLKQAAQGLSQEEKVISVRLALFAEMMKSKTWSCKTLADLGGIAGVGVTFLEETFGSAHAPIQFRHHQEGVRSFLGALLPPVGSNIKGHSRQLSELQQLSGYEERPIEFAEMVSLLDKNLRLITPTDDTQNSGDANQSYQLTHDYLVPSLREWLTQKQRETKKGRAELKLAERAATWNANPEAKQLPTLLEWFAIRRLTESKKWTDGEQRLMGSASRYHGSRLATAATTVCMMGLLGAWGWSRISNQRLEDAAVATADRWLTLEPNKLSDLLPRIRKQAPWISDDLQRAAQDPALSAEQKSRALIGLDIISEISAEQWSIVANTMLEQPVDDFLSLCKLLQDSKPPLSAPFRSILNSSESTPERKLLAAAGLSFYDPDCESMRSVETGRLVADGIAKSNPIYLRAWQEAFHPIAARLIPVLQDRFNDAQSTEVQKNLVATVLADYAKADADKLAELISVADPANWKTFFGPIRALGAQGISSLQAIATQELKPQWNDPLLDPSWKEVDSTTKLSFEQARGRIDERFAYVQAMPLEKFLAIAESLRSSGYRPTRVRPWAWAPRSDGAASESSDETLVAAVFTRDGKRWEIDANLQKALIPSGDQPAAKEDLVLDDVSALPSSKQLDPNFIALWTEPVSDKDIRHALIDLRGSEMRSELELERFAATGGLIRIGVRNQRGSTRRYNAIHSDLGLHYNKKMGYSGGQRLSRPQRDIALAEPRKRLFSAINDAKETIAELDALSDAERTSIASNTESLADYAMAMLAIRDYRRALVFCDDGLKNWPDSSELRLPRLMALVRLGRRQEATEALAQFLALQSNEPFRAYAQIQVAYLTEGAESAMQMIRSYRDRIDAEFGEQYNVFCGTALCADMAPEADKKAFVDIAVELLESLVASGNLSADQVTSDVDLVALHSEPRFLAALNAMDPPMPFMGIWDTDTTIETRVIPEDPIQTGRGWIDGKQVANLMSEGWRPTAIAMSDWGSDSDPKTPYGSMVFTRPLIPEDLNESTATKQAHALLALYELGEHERVWAVMKRCPPDARVRSLFQFYLAAYGADPQSMVVAFLSQSPESDAVASASKPTGTAKPWAAALAISLGDFQRAKMLSEEQQGRVRSHALKLLVEDVDPGVHGACEWLLKQLGAEAELPAAYLELATGSVVGNRNWYRTKSSGDTMVVLGPAEFVMGSPIGESERYGGPNETDESRHRRKIDYRFAIASTETTVEQFQRFRANHSLSGNFSQELDSPANTVSWFDAVAYCNWLSRSEGIPTSQHCYVINSNDPMDVVIPADILSRTGYRLPTEAEWEFACRAGSVTARHYGETKELLPRFAWYADNSGSERTIPVGTMRPNDFGLFDMLGNILEWNHNADVRHAFDPGGLSSEIWQSGPVDLKEPRLVRGGSFDIKALYVRSSDRVINDPTVENFDYGFRASRTYP